ncbi:MAG: DUF4364 family protein [Cellulosilyticaceae bacterium]
MLYSNEDFTINKLIVLYLLSEVKMPLTLSQITQFILERGYTDYFSMQQYLNQLVDAQLIMKSNDTNVSQFEISPRGLQTLEFFATRIPSSIRKELDLFIENNWRKLRSEIDIFAEYVPFKEHEYIVHCKVTENDSPLIDLKLNVVSKKQAIKLCERWKENSDQLYSEIIQLLSK